VDFRQAGGLPLPGSLGEPAVTAPCSDAPIPNIFGDSRQWGSKEAAMAAEKVDPSEYRVAPVGVRQTVHVIYLVSPLK